MRANLGETMGFVCHSSEEVPVKLLAFFMRLKVNKKQVHEFSYEF